ncbi:MAG: 6-phosphogluconolactonase [Acidobacteriia bacterium]|nr:6-phosphogluconolactonase [Terriglobia bacterium]
MSAQQPSNALRRAIEIYNSLEELSQAAAERFIAASDVAIQARGRFTVVLSGGSTPRSLYSLLATEPYSTRIDWQKVHFFWGDERSVPPIHKDSNFRMVRETLLSKVNPPLTNIHRIPAEKTVASEAAKAYVEELKSFFSLREGEWPRFDLVLLGMGPDGHTASLFPDTLVLHEATSLVAAPWVDKLKCYRITLTPPALNHASQIVFFVAGPDKAPSLREVLEGSFRPETYPAQLIRPLDGKVTWMVDREASAELRPEK